LENFSQSRIDLNLRSFFSGVKIDAEQTTWQRY